MSDAASTPPPPRKATIGTKDDGGTQIKSRLRNNVSESDTEDPLISMNKKSSAPHSPLPPRPQLSDTPETHVTRRAKAGAATPQSRWTALLLELGATAGGLSLALSYESRRRLKYCISWMQYAIAHTEHHITVLRAIINDMRKRPSTLVAPVARQLARIRKDITNIIRAVITVASQHASNTLPENALKLVRQGLLSLPSCCANKLAALQLPESDAESSSSNGLGPASTARCEEAATKVLTLAVESLDIIRNVAQVIGDVVDRADIWAQRLRLVQSQEESLSSDAIKCSDTPNEEAKDPPSKGIDVSKERSAISRKNEPPSKLPTNTQISQKDSHSIKHIIYDEYDDPPEDLGAPF